MLLTCVIPVRDPGGVSDWDSVMARMEVTVESIYRQVGEKPQIIVVASPQTPLPAFDVPVDIVEYHRLPLELPDSGEERDSVIRRDKGTRAMTGLVESCRGEYVMLVDYDDLISRSLTSFIEQEVASSSHSKPGWYVDEGYLMDHTPFAFYLDVGFNEKCGTSLIIRKDLLNIPESVEQIDEQWASKALGSHKMIRSILSDEGQPLERLPFPGAVYRIGYKGNTSGYGGVRKMMFSSQRFRKIPRTTLRQLAHLRTVRSLSDEFGC